MFSIRTSELPLHLRLLQHCKPRQQPNSPYPSGSKHLLQHHLHLRLLITSPETFGTYLSPDSSHFNSVFRTLATLQQHLRPAFSPVLLRLQIQCLPTPKLFHTCLRFVQPSTLFSTTLPFLRVHNPHRILCMRCVVFTHRNCYNNSHHNSSFDPNYNFNYNNPNVSYRTQR